MQRRTRSWLLALSALLAVLALASAPASAQSLDALRAAGTVGERFDGLALVRDPGASAEVQSMVQQVNQQRQQIYGQRASQEGVPVDQVGRVYAAEILRNAPPGTWFLGENGQWARK